MEWSRSWSCSSAGGLSVGKCFLAAPLGHAIRPLRRGRLRLPRSAGAPVEPHLLHRGLDHQVSAAPERLLQLAVALGERRFDTGAERMAQIRVGVELVDAVSDG